MRNLGPDRGHVYPIVRKARLHRAHLGAQGSSRVALHIWLKGPPGCLLQAALGVVGWLCLQQLA